MVGFPRSSVTGREWTRNWRLVVAGFFVTFAYSTVTSYGVFIKPVQESFASSRAEVSLALSINTLMYALSAIVFGVLSDRLGPRKAIVLGGAMVGVGLGLSAIARSSSDLVLFFGLLAGMGVGSLFIPPSTAIISRFKIKSTLALGVADMGDTIGTVIIPPIAVALIVTQGWRFSMLLLGVIAFSLVAVGSVVIGSSFSESGIAADRSSLRESAIAQAVRMPFFYLILALYTPITLSVMLSLAHLAPYTADIGLPPEAGALVLSVVGASMGIGRMTTFLLTEKLGLRIAVTLNFLLASLAFLLLQTKSQALLYPIAAVLGITFGSLPLMLYVRIASFYKRQGLGGVLGLIDGISWGVGGLIGPLYGGLSYDFWHSYDPAFLSLATLMLGTATLNFVWKTRLGKSVYKPFKDTSRD